MPTPKKFYRLKKDVKVFRHDPYKSLTDEKKIAQAFWDCLKDNDPEGAMEMISIYMNAVNKLKLSQEEEIPRSTLYYSMKNKNPTLKTVAKFLHCLSWILPQLKQKASPD